MQHLSWENVKKEVLNEKMSRKIISGEKAMLAQIFIAKGGVVPLHQHESEQLSYVLEGALKFELEGKEVVVRKGEVLLIPSTSRTARWRWKTSSVSMSSALFASIG